MKMIKISAATFAASLSATMGFAGAIPFTDDWKMLEFRSIPATEYVMNGATMEIIARKSSSVIYSPLDKSNWQAFNASWSWQAMNSVPPTDLSKKGADDRNIAIYFVFLDLKTANKIGSTAGIKKLLSSRKSRILVYAFGGDKPDGTMQPNPYLGKRGAIIVLRQAKPGAYDEVVDLAADYEKAFGEAAQALVGIAIASDSDNSDMVVTARISDLVLR